MCTLGSTVPNYLRVSDLDRARPLAVTMETELSKLHYLLGKEMESSGGHVICCSDGGARTSLALWDECPGISSCGVGSSAPGFPPAGASRRPGWLQGQFGKAAALVGARWAGESRTSGPHTCEAEMMTVTWLEPRLPGGWTSIQATLGAWMLSLLGDWGGENSLPLIC